MFATDIESCTRCSIPVLPGDEITVFRGEVMHVDHTVEKTSAPALREPVYA